MLDFLRRYRELIVVAALLVLPLLLYLSGRKPEPDRNVFDRVILAIAAPLQKAVVSAAEAAQDLWHGYVYLVGVEEENVELRRRLLRLEAQVQRAEEIARENDRLRALLDLGRRSTRRAVAAPVVGVGTNPGLVRSIRLGQGEAAGVRVGDPVVTHAGVVGRVVSAGAGYADVLLLADPNSAVPVIVARSRARATVRGTGELSRAVLDHALRTDAIQEGDLLLTSGTGGIFPKGLPVGRVSDVQRKPYGMFQRATVIPAVDLSKVEEVLVLAAGAPAPAKVDPRPEVSQP